MRQSSIVLFIHKQENGTQRETHNGNRIIQKISDPH